MDVDRLARISYAKSIPRVTQPASVGRELSTQASRKGLTGPSTRPSPSGTTTPSPENLSRANLLDRRPSPALFDPKGQTARAVGPAAAGGPQEAAAVIENGRSFDLGSFRVWDTGIPGVEEPRPGLHSKSVGSSLETLSTVDAVEVNLDGPGDQRSHQDKHHRTVSSSLRHHHHPPRAVDLSFPSLPVQDSRSGDSRGSGDEVTAPEEHHGGGVGGVVANLLRISATLLQRDARPSSEQPEHSNSRLSRRSVYNEEEEAEEEKRGGARD